MKRIYYKEDENIDNKKDYILTFIKSGDYNGKYFPETYFKSSDRIQCRPTRRRSFSDIYALFKTKFKTATKGELARILLNKENGYIGLFYCDSTRKLMVDNREHSAINSFINNNGNIMGPFMNHEYLKFGPSFTQVLNMALKSNKFALDNVKINKRYYTH